DDVWAATYIDGDDVEVGSLALGPDESVYVAGDTRYAVLTGIGPTSARANPDCEDYHGCEGFVVRFDAALSTGLGGHSVGGSLADSVRGLAIGPGGDVWVVGDTRSPDFAGVGANAVDSDVSPAGWDGFVARLDASLHAFEAATYLGGSGETFPSAVAFDGSGRLYVTGTTNSPAFPGAGAATGYDAFVAHLSPSLDAVLSATLFGGSDDDGATELAIDAGGTVYILGGTASGDLPGISVASSDPFPHGAFLASFDPSTWALTGVTYLGGTGYDTLNALAIAPDGNVVVAGETESTDFSGVGPDAFDAVN